MRGLFLIFFATVIFSNITSAQTYSQLSKSDTVTLTSAIFQTERKIIITKSKELKAESTNNNCILYLDANFKNLNGIFLQSANNLIANNEIPPGYLIGIMQQDRNTELLEKDKLLRFISEEVIPWLEKEYNISKRIAIAGHSFGAYFATYAFLKNNNVFNSCIALSPAYWPNEGDVLKLMDEKIKNNDVNGDFYLLVGDKRWDEISLRDYVFKAVEILNHTKTVRFKFNDLNGFSHNATPTVGFGLGLGFVYDEWEWENILVEQENRLKSFPDFWGHLEIKADALFHLKRMSEAKTVYKEALKVIPKDEDLSKKNRNQILKRINRKIKNCR